jgi:hypothetical protein
LPMAPIFTYSKSSHLPYLTLSFLFVQLAEACLCKLTREYGWSRFKKKGYEMDFLQYSIYDLLYNDQYAQYVPTKSE